MRSRRGTMSVVTMAACLVVAGTGCSSGESDTNMDATASAVEGAPAGLPKAPPLKLPAFWDGMDGGLFEFSGKSNSIAYTSAGILTFDAADLPVIWTWDGQALALKPPKDGDNEVKVSESDLVHRDGRWYLVSQWRSHREVPDNALGDGEYISGITTWDDTGSVVFHGEHESTYNSDIDGKPGAQWGVSSDGYLVNHPLLMKIDNLATGKAEIRLDPFTGEVRLQTAATEEQRQTAEAPLSEALTASGAWTGDTGTVTFTNTKSGSTTAVTAADARCAAHSTPTREAVVSSFDGRYIAIGQRVIDTKTNESTCLDPTGYPQLSAITSSGVAYGSASQNGNQVIISYDFATQEITVHRDAMVVPDFVGPDDIAVVGPRSGQSLHGVYRTADQK